MFKFMVLLFLILLFFQPEKGITGAKEGLVLWYNAILPAQLPFVVGVKLFMKRVSFAKLSPVLGSFAAGVIAGYPMGSMTTAQLYREGLVPKRNLTSLAACSNMAGPLFVIGTVGSAILGNVYWGYILLLVHWSSAAILSICLIKKTKGNTKANFKIKKGKLNKIGEEKQSIGFLMGETMGETAELMLKIACFIVLFAVLKQWIGGAGGAILEMSGGIQWLVKQKIDIKWKLVGCSFLINFSGICVILQSLGTMEKVPVSAVKYISCKILQGMLSAGLMLVICQFLIL